MQTVRLGRTNVEVSVAGLGCGGHSRLGMARGADAHQAADVVRRALDLGVSFIDTARAYGTEAAVGEAIAGRRDAVFLSTKAGVGAGGQLVGAAELAESLEGSLRRLGVDHVDLFHLHGVQPGQYDHCAQVLVPELKRQQAAGKIRFVGITEQFGGDTGHAMLPRALADDHFDVVMVGFNLINPSSRERVFPLTRAIRWGSCATPPSPARWWKPPIASAAMSRGRTWCSQAPGTWRIWRRMSPPSRRRRCRWRFRRGWRGCLGGWIVFRGTRGASRRERHRGGRLLF